MDELLLNWDALGKSDFKNLIICDLKVKTTFNFDFKTSKLYLTSECLASLGPPRVTGEPRSQGEQW